MEERSKISPQAHVSEIVRSNYRTADVFTRYGIEFCCGGRWPLEILCANQGIELDKLMADLYSVTRPGLSYGAPDYESWSPEFMAEYMIKVYHQPIRASFPMAERYLHNFLKGHLPSYPGLAGLPDLLEVLRNEAMSSLSIKEEKIFPYILQLAKMYRQKEIFAGLLVRTLRKPVEHLLDKDSGGVEQRLQEVRYRLSDYELPENACTSHRVAVLKLAEIDDLLMQNRQLETQFLFPRVTEMEKSLVQ